MDSSPVAWAKCNAPLAKSRFLIKSFIRPKMPITAHENSIIGANPGTVFILRTNPSTNNNVNTIIIGWKCLSIIKRKMKVLEFVSNLLSFAKNSKLNKCRANLHFSRFISYQPICLVVQHCYICVTTICNVTFVEINRNV